MTLLELHCSTPRQGLVRLDDEAQQRHLQQTPAWQLGDGTLQREFRFHDYYQTIAFVNAVAWVAHQQDHHPEITVGYNRCRVSYTTHAVGGISLNDFICAAHIDRLEAEGA